jgi:ubiquinone/menaquinone biosynthesis C-methylase UbiE
MGQMELMDQPGQDAAALREDLRNLGRINRYFGGSSAVRKSARELFQRMPRGCRVVWVDLATGYGDHPRTIFAEAKRAGIQLHIVALDQMQDTLRLARQATPAEAPIIWVQGDIRQLPVASGSCDAVLCTLALHHFSKEDAVRVLTEMRRISRGPCVCIDLKRGRIAQGAVWLLTTLWMRHPMTVHDARLSVRRAFSFQEMKGLAEQAKWNTFIHQSLPFFRQKIIR